MPHAITSLQLDADALRTWVAALRGDPDAAMLWQCFDDSPAKDSRKARALHGSVEDCIDRLNTAQAQSCGIFAAVHLMRGSRRSNSECSALVGVIGDFDQPEEIGPDVPCRPSVLVETSRAGDAGLKHQAVWLFDRPVPTANADSCARIDSLHRVLVERFDADPAAVDRARVFRAPGSWHLKNPDEPFGVRLVFSNGPRYTLDELEARFGVGSDPSEDTGFVDALDRDGRLRFDHTDAIATIEAGGEGLHDALRSEATRLARKGLSAGETAAALRSMIPDGDRRLKARKADIDRLARTAVDLVRKTPSHSKADTPKTADGVTLRPASTIEAKPLAWAWKGHIPRGMTTIIAGAPGTMKTGIASAVAAVLSTGGTFPDGTKAPRGSTIFWSGEDSAEHTLVPRLKAAGADLSKILIVGSACDGIDEERPFDPARDMPALARAAESIDDLALIILDPITQAIAGDSHKASEVRRGLAPVVALAERTGAALLGISHYSKGTHGRDPVERVTGSIAFAALARVVLATARRTDPDGSVSLILARAKSNIGPSDGGFSYCAEPVTLPGGIETVRVAWGDPMAGHARELLTEQDEQPKATKGETAHDWLAEVLQNGPMPVAWIRQAAAQKFGWRTIESAKGWLGVESVKKGTAWLWQLPTGSGEEI